MLICYCDLWISECVWFYDMCHCAWLNIYELFDFKIYLLWFKDYYIPEILATVEARLFDLKYSFSRTTFSFYMIDTFLLTLFYLYLDDWKSCVLLERSFTIF